MAKKEPDWARARLLWEAAPQMSQAEVARMLGVSKMAVTRRIKSEGWKKVAEDDATARVVRQRALDRADERTADLASKRGPQPPVDEATPEDHPDAAGTSAAAVETAVEMRAKILERHRREWDGARNKIYKAIQAEATDPKGAFEKAKLGKITAEALQIIQNGERKAWGLDSEEKTVKLTYEDGKDGSW